jgi:hypothetical protein
MVHFCYEGIDMTRKEKVIKLTADQRCKKMDQSVKSQSRENTRSTSSDDHASFPRVL